MSTSRSLSPHRASPPPTTPHSTSTCSTANPWTCWSAASTPSPTPRASRLPRQRGAPGSSAHPAPPTTSSYCWPAPAPASPPASPTTPTNGTWAPPSSPADSALLSCPGGPTCLATTPSCASRSPNNPHRCATSWPPSGPARATSPQSPPDWMRCERSPLVNAKTQHLIARRSGTPAGNPESGNSLPAAPHPGLSAEDDDAVAVQQALSFVALHSLDIGGR